MADPVVTTDTLRLYRRDTERWTVFSFEGDEKPLHEDVSTVFGQLTPPEEVDAKPVCVVVSELRSPNSRMLAGVVSLLAKRDGTPRRVALAGPTKGWLDMLDILGVRSSFVIVDDAEELVSEA